MGKYIRKAKTTTTGEVSVMEVTQSSLGVRTRAKTLASSRKSPSQSPTSSGCYLQLRSRRLLKPPILVHTQYSSKRSHKPQPQHQNPNPSPKNSNPSNPNPRGSSRLRMGSAESIGSFVNNNNYSNSTEGCQKKGLVEESDAKCHTNATEGSFGDNVLEFEGRERSTRESTPCSLIRDTDAVRTPGSTTRPTSLNENNRRIQNADQRPIPTAHEMNEFFAGAEEEQQRAFMEKYNFDPVNEKPLPGRYEWEKLDP